MGALWLLLLLPVRASQPQHIILHTLAFEPIVYEVIHHVVLLDRFVAFFPIFLFEDLLLLTLYLDVERVVDILVDLSILILSI
ncbi:hypothetical protein DFH06DRAFT_1349669 [Mycena polygramma]|nr:hypothetical protein DFH06DRAFT_1349669 [Mycena polygramma]